jgi:hypothetical protein
MIFYTKCDPEEESSDDERIQEAEAYIIQYERNVKQKKQCKPE